MKQHKAGRRARVSIGDRPAVIASALGMLKLARANLRQCGCKHAADYLSKAMKSSEGALNHAKRRASELEVTTHEAL